MYNVSYGIKCLLYRERRNRLVSKSGASFHESTFQRLTHFLLGSRIAGYNRVPVELLYELNYGA